MLLSIIESILPNFNFYYNDPFYIFENLIKNYPDKPWNWEWIKKNTYIPIEKYISLNIVEKYKDIWYYYDLSENPNLTEEFILKYPSRDWNISYLIKNNKITNFNALSKFINITQYTIGEYPDKLWDWESLIKYTNLELEKYIPFNLIKKYPYKWDYNNLSENLNLTEDFILKYPSQDWNIIKLIENNKITDFNALSKFKNIKKLVISTYPSYSWDWKWLIDNNNIYIKYIPIELIEKYKNKWNYYYLSYNQNLTEEFILKYPYKKWNIIKLIKNNKITDFNTLSKFKNIDDYCIDNNPWNWKWMIENTGINVEEYISFNLIKKYSYKWNYWELSKNQNITEEFILKYPYQDWDIEYLIKNNKITDFNALSKFKNINVHIIKNYSNKPWDLKWLIENCDINIKNYILNNLNKNNLKYNKLIENSNITKEIILKYPYKKWNIANLIINNKITDFNTLSKFKYLNKYIIHKNLDKPWDWEWIIENTNINLEECVSLELIEKYPYKWNYWNLSGNQNITEEFILKYPNKNWNIIHLIENNKITDFNTLSKFKSIDQYIIDNYSDKPWDWEWFIIKTSIDVKKYISLNLIEKYKNKWDYYDLSKNINLVEDFIIRYFYENWDIEYLIENNKITDFNSLSRFKNLTKDILYDYSDKPWDWEWIIENTNIIVEEYISLELIEKYKHKWDYCKISNNPNITEEFIMKYPNKNWNIEYLIENNKITDFNSLSKFRELNKNIINKYPNKSWDKKWLNEYTNFYYF